MEYFIYKDEDELIHWGIKGMRWGIRRYQNKDGSLTKAGQKRLKAETEKVKKEETVLKNRKAVKAKLDKLDARRKAVEEGKKELDGDKNKLSRKSKKGSTTDDANSAKKSIKDMTDDELTKAINRARLEETYNQLHPAPPVKQSFMKKMVSDVIAPAAVNSGKKLAENAFNKLGEKILGGKVDPDGIDTLKKTYERLDLQNKIHRLETVIDKRKKGIADDDFDLTWDERIKKQTWERNERERIEEEAKKKKGNN